MAPILSCQEPKRFCHEGAKTRRKTIISGCKLNRNDSRSSSCLRVFVADSVLSKSVEKGAFMSFWSFPKYVRKAEKKARAEKKLNQLKKKHDVRPVIIEGSAIARTWWGKAWNKNLERYADYSNRIGRGRSYVRCGAVLDLQINAGEIKALVHGSRAKPYSINIKIKKLDRNAWQQVASECAGMLESLEELLAGKFPKGLEEVFMQRDAGLFPSPKEIDFDCSCPDWASMCKHVAAALYGIGARLDEDPSLFFTLRGVDTGDLISRTVASKAESLLKKASKKSSRIIEDSDLSAIFGIDLAGAVGSSQPAGDSAKEILAAGGVRKAGPRKTARGGAKKKGGSAQAVKPSQKSVAKRDVVKRKARGAVKAATKKQTRGGKKKQ